MSGRRSDRCFRAGSSLPPVLCASRRSLAVEWRKLRLRGASERRGSGRCTSEQQCLEPGSFRMSGRQNLGLVGASVFVHRYPLLCRCRGAYSPTNGGIFGLAASPSVTSAVPNDVRVNSSAWSLVRFACLDVRTSVSWVLTCLLIASLLCC